MRFWVGSVVFLLFVVSQFFWFRQVRLAVARFAPRASHRGLAALGLTGYALLCAYNFGWIGRSPEATHLTLEAVIFQAPFRWWWFSSLAAFLLIATIYFVDGVARALHVWFSKLFPSARPRHRWFSPARRRFLEKTAMALGWMPFAASAYGMLYERTDIETTHQPIKLRRLPKAFDGFRLAQLSDLHIGPFMTAGQIRQCVEMVNRLKPDAVALTGDFITWDASTAAAVVESLSGLRAPFGIVGCLGNHERWAHAEDLITRLFAERGVRILRLDRTLIESGGERLNVIGVDYQTHTRFGPKNEGFVREYLEGVEPLVLPDTCNILLSHNPNTFDRAAALGIDLSLAGHTHGGQVTLEFISPNLSPSRLITSYVRGWFQKGDSQLYVNRGIGTIGVPIRFASPPEITLYELRRG